MDKIVIIEKNRDLAKVWFEHERDNYYTIHSDKDYVLEYACCNYDRLPDVSEDFDFEFDAHNEHIKGKYHSFDPSGGPYMAIGDNINGKTLKRIFVENKKTLFELV